MDWVYLVSLVLNDSGCWFDMFCFGVYGKIFVSCLLGCISIVFFGVIMIGWLIRMGCFSIVLISWVLVMLFVFSFSFWNSVFLLCIILCIGMFIVLMRFLSVVWLGGFFRYLMMVGLMLLLCSFCRILCEVLYLGL